jgi:uncharacterized protein (DUF2225 family)
MGVSVRSYIANSIYSIALWLNYVIQGKIEKKGRRERRRKQLLDERYEKRRYWKFKEEALSEEFALEEAMNVA